MLLRGNPSSTGPPHAITLLLRTIQPRVSTGAQSVLHRPGRLPFIALGIRPNLRSSAPIDLLRPLPVPDPTQVVTLRSRMPSGTFGELSYPDFADLRDQNRSFDGLVAYQIAPCGVALDARAQSQLHFGFQVSGNFFRVLGVTPELGRGFNPDEDQAPGRDAVMVLSNDYWKSDFGGDSSVIGRHVRVNGIDFTVIGVAPKSFTGMEQFFRPAFFLPAMMGPRIYSHDLLTSRGERGWQVKGRLKPGVSIEAAGAEVAGLAKFARKCLTLRRTADSAPRCAAKFKHASTSRQGTQSSSACYFHPFSPLC